MKVVYGWEGTEKARNDTAQSVGEALEALRASHKGKLTPDDVIHSAKSPKSPLHSYFEWDESEAAHKYRLWQARQLIRKVVVKLERPGAEPVSTRAFVSVKMSGDEDPSYTRIDIAMKDVTMREQVLSQARTELLTWRNKYSVYLELSRIFSVIDEEVLAIV